METIKQILEYVPEIIDMMGVLILIIGFVRGVIEFFKVEIKHKFKKGSQFRMMQILRCDVGLYILLALDFMIISDIIISLTQSSMEELIELGIIVVLRTVIGFFLSKEVEEVHGVTPKSELEKDDE